jgi:hypothetical protein
MTIFDWDEANVNHIAGHQVTPEEVEELIENEPVDLDAQIRGDEERFTQVGETAAGRILIVVTTKRGEKTRVVTAYPAKERFRKIYAMNREVSDED